MWRQVRRPAFNRRVQLLAMRHAPSAIGEPRCAGPFTMSGNLAQSHPLRLALDRDDAPAVIAFAAVAAMGRRVGAEIPLRPGLAPLDEIFEISRSEHRRRRFCLRYID